MVPQAEIMQILVWGNLHKQSGLKDRKKPSGEANTVRVLSQTRQAAAAASVLLHGLNHIKHANDGEIK